MSGRDSEAGRAVPPLVRPYAPADEGAVRACFIALQDHEHAFAPEAPTGAALAEEYLPFMLARCAAPGGALLVAEAGGAVVGFASLLIRPRAEPDDSDAVHAEVAEFSVLPTHRGRGIGTALLAEAERRARAAGATSLRVRVDARNPEARRLYERAGFAPAVVHLHKPLR